jgi:uncharacterized protein (TIGR01777 family)
MKRYAKIVLAGGSGQIGTAIKEHFRHKTDELIILTRGKSNTDGNVRTVTWNGRDLGDWWQVLEGADLLVNLTGKNVNCRYTEKNKREILNSRVDSVNALVKACACCKVPPKLWIQCASATIYRHEEVKPMTEADEAMGLGFSEDVCRIWEATFNEGAGRFDSMRKVILRTSLVLGAKEGVYPRLKNLALFGLGGKQGNGRQWVSWVHEADVASMVEWILLNETVQGPVNCTSPKPVQNHEFMRIIREGNRRSFGLPAPAWLLEIGAWLIGTETELILKSRWVLPKKILDSGYAFKFPSLEEAVRQITGK